MPEEPSTEILKITEYTEKVMCDFGHKFHSNSAKRVPFKNITKASIGECMFVDDEDKVRLSQDSNPESGFLLACPICGVIHIEGFSVIAAGEEALQLDTTVADRNIQMTL